MKNLFFKLFSIPLTLFIGGAIADNCDDIAVQFINNTHSSFYVTYNTPDSGSGDAEEIKPGGAPYKVVYSANKGHADTWAIITLFDPKLQKIITTQEVNKKLCDCNSKGCSPGPLGIWGELSVPWNPSITFGNYTIETQIQGTYSGTNCWPGGGANYPHCDNANPGLVQVTINGP